MIVREPKKMERTMLLKMIMLLKFKPSKVDGKHAPSGLSCQGLSPAALPPGVEERSAEVSSCKTLKLFQICNR